MFSRLLVRSGAFNRRVVRPVSWVMAGVLGASFIQVASAPASADPKRNRPAVSDPSTALPRRDPLPVKPR